MFEMWSQGLANQSELNGSFVADGEFFVPRRDPSGLLEGPNPAFDFAPGLVSLTVEAGRATTGRTPAKAVPGLVALLRNGVRDLPATQVLADLTGGVRAVGQDVSRSGARRSATDPRNTDAVHNPGEHRGIGSLPSGDHSGQNVKRGVNSQVDPGGQAAARAARRVVVRLGRQAAGSRPGPDQQPSFSSPRRRAGGPGGSWNRPTPPTRDARQHRPCPATSSRLWPKCRRSASGGRACTRYPTDRTARVCPATASPCEHATRSRRRPAADAVADAP